MKEKLEIIMDRNYMIIKPKVKIQIDYNENKYYKLCMFYSLIIEELSNSKSYINQKLPSSNSVVVFDHIKNILRNSDIEISILNKNPGCYEEIEREINKKIGFINLEEFTDNIKFSMLNFIHSKNEFIKGCLEDYFFKEDIK